MPTKHSDTAPLIPYRAQWGLSLLVAVLIFVLTGLASQAVDLGLTRPQVVLVTLAVGALGLVQTVLPRVTAPPNPDRAGRD
jgi:undecaprenyl pyrophosphate phosphatase UppP